MKKLAGLLAFAFALACAIVLTQYYGSREPAPAPPPPPSIPALPVAVSDATTAGASVPVTFKTQLVALDFASRKAHLTLDLERDPARAAPERVWVWAYFFTSEASGRYCAGEPVEVSKPFAAGNRASVNVEIKVADCPAPRNASSTFYARVNVSSESSFAARLTEQRISYDITQASPVTIEGAQPKKR
ncbi:MAG TPA: hypothetical protein VEX60_15575 [Pyrinomonadaceae bacterium]|nr:hypothetical protein [Pyrinomonadaceae bacterium]